MSPLDLPRSVLGELLAFLDHRSVHQLEAASRSAKALVAATNVWRAVVLQQVALPEPEAQRVDWKRLSCIAAMACQRDRSLLLDVHACSSVDRPCESPSNTLAPSRCWLSMQSLSDRTLSRRLRSSSFGFADLATGPSSAIQSLAEVAQIECGCETAACYWSSSPSPSPHSRDFIEYTTRANCLVALVQVLPYRAFWHPDSPTFAPLSVSFEFFTSSHVDGVRRKHHTGLGTLMEINDAEAVDGAERVQIYKSPVYAMTNDMQVHEFELPKKVWLPQGTTFRLNLIGRYQRETFEMPPWIPADEQEPAEPPYYCCLSHVTALGVSIDYC